jgi:hypothetical protein
VLHGRESMATPVDQANCRRPQHRCRRQPQLPNRANGMVAPPRNGIKVPKWR